MGNVISRNAGTERIFEAASTTLTRATARGGEVQTLAETRLSALIAVMVTNSQQMQQAQATDDLARATLMARDSESDLEIGAVADEMWNALGRPAQSVDYSLIMGNGKNAWTDGDPLKQPHIMAVLAANIRNSNNTKLADKREAWAVRIEQKAAAQLQAAAPVEAANAQVSALTMQRRTLADATQVGLARLKRDYKNIGMTESQVHEIIPDAPVSSSATPPVPPPQPAPNTQSAPATQSGAAS